jgi:catechol 2,3-dioxygenase-like lactoylglutathione lyase family enzyme
MQILGCTPVFHVSNLDNALAFYRDVLGFTLDYRYGEPPYYAGLHLGPVYLNLNARGAARTAIGCGELYLLVDDTDAFYLRLADSGIAFDCLIGDRDYGMRDFALRDPDGNRIGVGAQA